MALPSTIFGASHPPKAGRGGRHTMAPETLGLLGVLVVAAVAYTWALASNGWANAYYSAAVQAGLSDPTAFFFGSADSGNSITVDKPPLSLWVLGLSCRIFGLNTWSLLLPQVITTLGSILLVFKLVRRSLPARIALIACGTFAMTPITVLLARYNNPDPLMILLMLAALYAGIRAAESGRIKFLILAAGFLGLGFLAKQLQAFLVLPAILVAFLLYAPRDWKAKAMSLLGAVPVLLGSAMAWPLSVDLIPASERPYIGGTATNSMTELTLGYNGLDRVLRQEADPWSALLPAEMQTVGSDAGFFRLFNSNYGQEIGWLLLPALISCAAIAIQIFKRRYSRNHAILAAASVAWMLTTFLVLSFMGSNFHSYYTASLAAPLALCLAQGAEVLLSGFQRPAGRVVTSCALIASFIFWRAMWQLSDVYPEYLGSALLVIGTACASSFVLPPPKAWIKPTALWTSAACLAVGPLFCLAITVATPQEGSNPLSGGVTRSPYTLSRFLAGIKNGDPSWGKGLALGYAPSPELATYLANASPGCRWAAAVYPGQTAARFQLEINRAVMPLGGFAATDPSPTLQKFQGWVASGQVCNLVVQPAQLEVPGNSPELLAIHEWAKANFRAQEVGDTLLYRFVP